MQKKKILVVEDEKELAKLVAFHLILAGYEVISAENGVEALEICKFSKPDLLILDIMLPRIDGWEVCRQLRRDQQTSQMPIIILSALSDIDDKLRGFDLGTDDYVTKPFSPRELVVRVKRVLSRSQAQAYKKLIRIGSLEINLEDMSITRNCKEIFLTEKEKDILKFLINNRQIVLTHSEILDAVWSRDNIVEYGNIDVHVRHLREKLEDDPENPRLITTVKGKGYRFEP